MVFVAREQQKPLRASKRLLFGNFTDSCRPCPNPARCQWYRLFVPIVCLYVCICKCQVRLLWYHDLCLVVRVLFSNASSFECAASSVCMMKLFPPTARKRRRREEACALAKAKRYYALARVLVDSDSLCTQIASTTLEVLGIHDHDS